MTALIQFENVFRYYGNQCAVREINFSVGTNGVTGLLGPNGAGKSTILNMISGNLAPSSGRILINGIDIVLRPLEAKRFLGYLPDIPPVHDDSTVDEYLRFCAKIHRIAPDQLHQCVQTAKERCGLGEAGKRLIRNLSKGFRQRVGVAQAVLHSPPLIVLDEPSVGLDPIQIREMRELIQELGENHAVMLSSHILPEVQSTCTRTLIVHQGRLVLDTDNSGLEHDMAHSCLAVKTRRPVELDILRRIDGVDSIEALSGNSYRIFFRKPHNPSEQISEIVVGNGWGLLELRPEHGTIEELFMQLTESTLPQTDGAPA
jgi:ABC-2 type transport system ATP-binding protein